MIDQLGIRKSDLTSSSMINNDDDIIFIDKDGKRKDDDKVGFFQPFLKYFHLL